MLGPLQIIKKLYSSYFVLFLLFTVIGFNKQPPLHNAFLQIVYFILGFLVCTNNINRNINRITYAIFVYQLVVISLTTWVNFAAYGDILGYEPIDPAFYRSCGELYGDKEYKVFFVWLIATFGTIDDWGFPSLVWFIYKICGEYAQIALRILNALLIALGSKYLYKLSIDFVDDRYAKLIALIWGIMPFATTVGAGGAKEDIFGFVVIMFFYYLYKYYKSPSLLNMLFTFLFAFGTLLFRLSCGYSTILCILSVILIRKRFIQKNFKILLFLCCIAAVAVFPFVLRILIEQRGLDDDVFSSGNEVKADAVGGFVGYLVNSIASLIGPIPCFISGDLDKLQFLTRYSLSPFIKMCVSFFFYYPILVVVKEKKLLPVPIYVFVFVNILMLIVAFFGLQVKFQWPQIPIFLVVSMWGYVEYFKRHTSNRLYSLYMLLVVLIILFYNIK